MVSALSYGKGQKENRPVAACGWPQAAATQRARCVVSCVFPLMHLVLAETL
jgi:hypothetical protein